MFLPTTAKELKKLGWRQLDIILISGDTYIDIPYMGVAVIGKVLLNRGYRVGIIAQPDIKSGKDISRLGAPSLFWGVTSGSVDSMLSNYTASKKRRNKDDLTPGGINNKRPDRALIVYSNLIRQHFKNTAPIVLGGIEASLRRVAHYDYWTNHVRRSIIFDAKADILVYGMGEKGVLDLARGLRQKEDIRQIKGICYISEGPVKGAIELPSYEQVSEDKEKFSAMFKTFYENNNEPLRAKALIQRHGGRYLCQNPPQPPLTSKELDQIYNLDYERDVPPYYKKQGKVKAIETIQFSITTHRGCLAECNFCAIALHQGRRVISRSKESILKEARTITKHPNFKGIISDAGGPTANMYAIECSKKMTKALCPNRRCLYPAICPNLKIDHGPQIELLRQIRRQVPKVKKVFVASGIRYDLVLGDAKSGEKYMRELLAHHISGQMKIAPEHTEAHVLKSMGKPEKDNLLIFKRLFNRLNKELPTKQFLTYYFIAAHPGCTLDDMIKARNFAIRKLRLIPEQVQIFTPTPSTFSTLMYWTGVDPFSGKRIFVEDRMSKKIEQKRIMSEQTLYP